jgi:hypothetical protein
MRRLLILTSIFAMMLAACLGPSLPAVSLVSPADGSAVSSIRPTLSWGTSVSGAAYHLVVAADSNFQSPVVDAGSLLGASYTIPAGKLSSNSVYYWRVIARKGDQESGWSAQRSFRTPGSSPANPGNISVSATLDGSPWAGSVNFRISGPFADSQNTIPWSFNNISSGSYTITYDYGGPSGASLANISPAPTQQLVAGRTINFTLNFQTPVGSRINVNATLDGAPWYGAVNYSIYGPFQDVDTMVPHTFISVAAGTYTVSYNSGGPSNAVFSNISPAVSQVLPSGGEITYTLNFTSSQVSNLSVTAYYNGAAWSGPARFSISGPVTASYSSVPAQLSSVPAGTYRITYQSGGPPGATLGGIVPDTTLVISTGRSGGFTLNYYSQPQNGSVMVRATLNGSPYSGAVNFAVSGPYQSTDYRVPRTYSSAPAGSYTISYLGGGPDGAVFSGISPSPTQVLSAGRAIVFTLNFVGQPNTGTITVYATVDGKSWQTNPGSGPISYTLTGPYLGGDSQEVIPGTWTQMPAGSYTLIYNSGGPIGATLTGISPSPSMNLPAGGSIAFTLNFTTQARGYVTVQATLDGRPWSGSVSYTVNGPYVESGQFVSQTFDNVPQGTYSVDFKEGGPPYSFSAGVSPSSQELSPGGYIAFTLMFTSLPGPNPNPPEPGPMPGPVPNPTPEPIPGPVPNPTPDEPMPGPVPNPTPEPGPTPGPIPTPAPEPAPAPAPEPGPVNNQDTLLTQ